MIVVLIELDAIDDCHAPFYDKALQSILLIEVGVHKLFHSLEG